jgi:hypothetical protein
VDVVIPVRQRAQHELGLLRIARLAQGDAVEHHHRVCSDDPGTGVAREYLERLAAGRRQRLAARRQMANAILLEG